MNDPFDIIESASQLTTVVSRTRSQANKELNLNTDLIVVGFSLETYATKKTNNDAHHKSILYTVSYSYNLVLDSYDI